MEFAQIAPLLPQGAIATVLVAIIGVLLRQNHQDRNQYRADVARIEARASADAKAAADNHSREMGEVREELRALRVELRASMDETEDERRKRWHAEDAAARYKRELEQVIGRTVES